MLEWSSCHFSLFGHLFRHGPCNQPTTIPLTPPSGFCRAVNRMPSRTSSGHCRQTTKLRPVRRIVNRLRSQKERTNGPAATPRLDFSKHTKKSLVSNWNCSVGSACAIRWFNGSLGCGGRFCGSVRAANVAKVPSANATPSKACLAADNSPNCTRDRALAAL